MIHPAPAEPPRILMVLRGGDPGPEPCLPGHLQAAPDLLSLDILLLEPPSPQTIAALQRLLAPAGQIFLAPAPAQPASSDLATQEALHLQALEAHLQHHRYDALLLDSLCLAYLRNAPNAPRSLLLAIDAMPSPWNTQPAPGIPEYRNCQLLSEASLILTSHFRTYGRLASLFPGRVLYTPPVMATSASAAVSGAAERIVITGTNSPNDADGLNWFLTQIWPCFHHADIELHVAGSVGETLDHPHPNLVLRGQLNDTQAFLRAAHIAIAPAYHGGTPPARLARYLSHGIPSILTPEAASGLPGGAGEAYLRPTSRTAFIDHLARLIEDRAARQQLSDAALHFSHTHFAARTPHRAIAALLRLSSLPRHEDLTR